MHHREWMIHHTNSVCLHVHLQCHLHLLVEPTQVTMQPPQQDADFPADQVLQQEATGCASASFRLVDFLMGHRSRQGKEPVLLSLPDQTIQQTWQCSCSDEFQLLSVTTARHH